MDREQVFPYRNVNVCRLKSSYYKRFFHKVRLEEPKKSVPRNKELEYWNLLIV